MPIEQPPDPSTNGRYPPEARALGEPTHIYKLSRRIFQRESGVGMVQIVVGLSAIAAGARIGSDGIWWAAVVGFLIGVTMLTIGVLHLQMIARERGVVTLVARNGIVRIGRHGVGLVRWRDMESIRVDPHHSRYARLYTLKLKTKRGYHYFDTTPSAIIGETIQYRHAREWLPKLVAQFDEGEVVHFRQVWLDQDGVHVRGQTFAWRSIHRFERRDGLINAFVQDQWYTIAAVRDVENVLLLLGLMEHAHKTRKNIRTG